eukprot:gb/GECG01015531.1/.p1 GENE.gb/GECG01015531.1/~~gb/GECG01015531.1/.p1  ORF type:complete len:280 (+),score=34.19 gb/GECG01015531.1/:1-840(+)
MSSWIETEKDNFRRWVEDLSEDQLKQLYQEPSCYRFPPDKKWDKENKQQFEQYQRETDERHDLFSIVRCLEWAKRGKHKEQMGNVCVAATQIGDTVYVATNQETTEPEESRVQEFLGEFDNGDQATVLNKLGNYGANEHVRALHDKIEAQFPDLLYFMNNFRGKLGQKLGKRNTSEFHPRDLILDRLTDNTGPYGRIRKNADDAKQPDTMLYALYVSRQLEWILELLVRRDTPSGDEGQSYNLCVEFVASAFARACLVDLSKFEWLPIGRTNTRRQKKE